MAIDKPKVLLVGYGSIGKRHARNLISLGVKPFILTRYPDNSKHAVFIRNLKGLEKEGITHCIIATPTARHLSDFRKCLVHLKGLKSALLEKPLESTLAKGARLKKMAKRNKVKVYVGYNLRFLSAFGAVRRFLSKNSSSLRIVEVLAGQDLRQWRPGPDFKASYSVSRNLGGGVDLDLSHEIDYVLWLFGKNSQRLYLYRDKISNLDISSPDYFKLILGFKNFVVDITLDYIRNPRERYLKIICDDAKTFHYNFTDIQALNGTYVKMLKAFLGTNAKDKSLLCNINQALAVLKVLEV